MRTSEELKINSLDEMSLYLHARRQELAKELEFGMYSAEPTDALRGRLLEVEGMIKVINR
jgi:hypothetical protein